MIYLEIKILKNEKKELEFKIMDERHTIPSILKDEIAKLSYVDFVAYRLEHPSDKDSIFLIKVNSKSPKTALQEAIKNIKKNLGETKKEFKKALGS